MDFNHIRPEHVCQPVDKVAEKHREALQTCCDVLDAKQAEVEKSLKYVTDAEMALKLAADNAKEEISKRKNDIIKAVEEVFELKMNEVDLVYSNHDGKLASERNKGKSALDKVKCAGNLSRNMLQKGSHEEIIESRIMVEERVENVKKECGNLPKNYKINKKWFTAKQVEIEMVSKLFGAGICSSGFDYKCSENLVAKNAYINAYVKVVWACLCFTFVFIALLAIVEPGTVN